MKKQLIRTAAASLLLLIPTTAFAQDDADRSAFSGYTTIGAAAVPDYEGADDYRVLPLVDGKVSFGDRYIALEGVSLRGNIINREGFEFGPVASFTFGRDGDANDPAVARLPAIDDAYEVGAFAAVSLAVNDNDRVRFAVQGVHDVSDVHRGYVVSANASYTAPVGDRLMIVADVSASYANDDYAQTYFSVTSAGRLASGLIEFTANGGIKDVGAQLTACYRIGNNWGIAANAGYRRLLNDFADSPVVSVGGSANQLSGGIGVFFTF